MADSPNVTQNTTVFGHSKVARVLENTEMMDDKKQALKETSLVNPPIGFSTKQGTVGAAGNNPEEQALLDLYQKVLTEGEVVDPQKERTGTGTIRRFGDQVLTFSLAGKQLPLLTTKHTSFGLILSELLWMLRGETSAKKLADDGCNIWNANASRAALDKRQLFHLKEGDCGPIYGFQWRHFGAVYTSDQADYKGQGVDQIANLEVSLKQNPFGRDHILCSWNAADTKKSCLPPCHAMAQFSVRTKRGSPGVLVLDCCMFQRSCDLFLGVPFNIGSYATLTHLFAHVCGYEPGNISFFMGDHHIYLNAVDAVKTQISRKPAAFPTLLIQPKAPRKHVWEFQKEDFVLKGYAPQGRLSVAMAV